MPKPIPRRTIAIASPLLVTIALLVAGCGAAPKVRPVAARPVVVAGPEGTPDAAGYLVDIELENTGEDDIPLERFDYVFEVEGVGRFSGRWVAFLTLPPGSRKRIEIPASMPLPADLAQQVDLSEPIVWRIDGGLRYQAPGLLGRILFDAGIRRPSKGFSGSGTFRLTPPAQTDPASVDPERTDGAEPA